MADFIQIPLPDFSLADVVKKKANDFCGFHLSKSGIISMVVSGHDTINISNSIRGALINFTRNEDKLVFIQEILTHLKNVKYEIDIMRLQPPDSNSILGRQFLSEGGRTDDFIQELQFELYQQLSAIGYNLNTNTFSSSEILDLERKINAILIKLDQISVGQEVNFDEIGSLKADITDLKSDFISGKKRWHQRLAGIIASFAGNKSLELIVQKLKPEIIEILRQQGVNKLLGF